MFKTWFHTRETSGQDASNVNQVLEQAIDGVVSIDENNVVTFFNAASEKLWGYSKAEVIGKNVKMLVSADVRTNHDELVNRNRRTGEDKIVGLSRDIEITRKDGATFWGNLSLSKVEVGSELHYTAFIKDITAQRRGQEVINQTLEQALDAIVTIDAQNKVTFFNAAAEKLWGYSREDILGENVSTQHSPQGSRRLCEQQPKNEKQQDRGHQSRCRYSNPWGTTASRQSLLIASGGRWRDPLHRFC